MVQIIPDVEPVSDPMLAFWQLDLHRFFEIGKLSDCLISIGRIFHNFTPKYLNGIDFLE